MLKQIAILQMQSNEIVKARDFLLPRIMNNEVLV